MVLRTTYRGVEVSLGNGLQNNSVGSTSSSTTTDSGTSSTSTATQTTTQSQAMFVTSTILKCSSINKYIQEQNPTFEEFRILLQKSIGDGLTIEPGCSVPCSFNGVLLTNAQKQYLIEKQFQITGCPEEQGSSSIINIPCDQLKNYHPEQLATMIRDSTHEVNSDCLYPCHYRNIPLTDEEKAILIAAGVQIDEKDCPCPEGLLKNLNGQCVPKDQIDIDEKEDPLDPVELCPEGKTWDRDSQSCVDINPCGPGLIYDPIKNECKEPPECDESRGVRINPQTGNCESMCKIGEYWDGSKCVPIPTCGDGTRWDPSTNSCIPDFDQITCGDGTQNVNGVCVSIYGPPEPKPPDINVSIIILPPDSGNNITEDPDPDNSVSPPIFLSPGECADPPPPPPPPLPLDQNIPGSKIFPTGRHIYVLQNKIGIEQDYIFYPYKATGVDDIIRAMTGYFWYLEDRQISNINNKLIPVYRKQDEPNRALLRYAGNIGNQGWSQDYIQYYHKASIELVGIKNSIALEHIDAFDYSNLSFSDHVFSCNKAIDNSINNFDSNYTFEKQSKYNYYIDSYEKLLNSANSPSIYEMPNYYLLSENSAIRSQATEQYYDNYVSNWLDNPLSTQKTKNIIFEYDNNLDNLISEQLIPFYNKISFNLEKDKRQMWYSIPDDRKKNILDLLLFLLLATEEYADKEKFKNTYCYQDTQTLETIQNIRLLSLRIDNSDILFDHIRKTTKYHEPAGRYFQSLMDKITFLNEFSFNTAFDFEKQMIEEDYYGDIINLSNLLNANNRRYFVEILKGKQCYSETLFYKIEKYEEGNESPVQNIWLYNDNREVFNYIDTQIRYATNYTYVVKSYKCVLANNYKYDTKLETNKPNIAGKHYKLGVTNNIEHFIVESEYARIPAIVVDKPPPAPEIEVIPFKDNSEKVLVMFNPSTVEYKRAPVAFNEQERQFYQILTKDGKVTFGGDDKTKKYLIYRIEHHPSSYEDFYDQLYAEVEPECNCTTAEYIQNLEPNKKYYFVFRSIDIHDHISYPTVPYLVELINEGGTIFLDFRGVDFIDKDYKLLTKSAKRFIHIKPNLQQSLLTINDPTRDSALDAIQNKKYNLGQDSVEKKLWDKNFKLKIISKNTKKQINIKFKFVIKENKDLITNLEESC